METINNIVVTRMDKVHIKYQTILLKFNQVFKNMVSPGQFMKANHFETVLNLNHKRSVPNPAVVLCLNRVLFIRQNQVCASSLLIGVKIYKFPWYLLLISANPAYVAGVKRGGRRRENGRDLWRELGKGDIISCELTALCIQFSALLQINCTGADEGKIPQHSGDVQPTQRQMNLVSAM